MNKTILGFLFIVLSFKVLQAQTVLVGVGSGVNLILLDNGGQFGIPLYLSFSTPLNKTLELEFCPGISGAEYYKGFEFGSYLRIFLREQLFYLSIGIKFHKNEYSGTISTHIRDDLYLLPTLGIGSRTKVDKTFLIFEVLYQKPFPNGLTYFIIGDQYYYRNDFFGVVSLNVGLAWEL
jgi:hypothetical protein